MMTNAQAKKLIVLNLVVWMLAIVVPALLRMLPTASGNPPKIYDVLIPLFSLALAGVSTYLLKAAIGKTQGD